MAVRKVQVILEVDEDAAKRCSLNEDISDFDSFLRRELNWVEGYGIAVKSCSEIKDERGGGA